MAVPVVEEEAAVYIKTTERSRVRVRKVMDTRTETIDAPVVHEDVHIERRAVNRVVETVPLPRQEGDTWIIPLVEEEVILHKRLVLKEELLITRKREEVRERKRVELRSERAVVERVPPQASAEQTHRSGGRAAMEGEPSRPQSNLKQQQEK